MLVRVGDLIKIPLAQDLAALGQVVLKRRHGLIVLAVFPATNAGSDAAVVGQLKQEPHLIVETMNVLIGTGHWAVIGNASVAPNMPLPVYVVPVGLDRIPYLQDVEGNILRPATQTEAESLRMPASYSPALVEDAARAANGIGEWLQNYDDMRVDRERSALRILGANGGE